MQTVGITFVFPWALLTLVALPFLPKGRNYLLRVCALTLFIMALAEPELARPSRNLAILVDVSDSLGTSARHLAQQLDLSQLAQSPARFYFAGDTTPISTFATPVPAIISTQHTDIARALQVAAATGAQRALLISDGASHWVKQRWPFLIFLLIRSSPEVRTISGW